MKSIQTKAILLVIIVMAVTFLSLIIFAITAQRKLILTSARDQLVTDTRMLDSVLRNIMISGQAEIMLDTLTSLQELQAFEEISIYNTDGDPVFSGSGAPQGENELFQQVLETAEPVRRELQRGRQIEYFFPIMNSQACYECHGSDHTIRGVEYFRVSLADRFDNIRRNTTILVISLVTIALLTCLVFVLFLRRIIISPVRLFQTTMARLSTGDLTGVQLIRSSDEIGQLSKDIGNFVHSLGRNIKNLIGISRQMHNTSRGLAKSSVDAVSALEQMRVNMEGMKSEIDILDHEVASSRTASSNVQQHISEVAGLIAKQAAAVNQSSAATEQMSASIRSIARSAEERLRVVHDLGESARVGAEDLENTNKKMRGVVDSTHVIHEMISVIENIAAQTDLLAINASIEAAHAGAAGKGFAVVASEIRRLAESSSQSAQEIKKKLTTIEDSVIASADSTGRSGTIFSEIVGNINQVGAGMQEMKEATGELALGSDQIREALAALVSLSQKVSDASNDINQKMESIAESMQNLNKMSTDAKLGITEIAVGISEVAGMAEQVSRSGSDNSEGVAALESIINQFTVEPDQ